MDLAEHLRVIWRRKWRVLGVAAILALLVYARGKTLPERFASDATLQVSAGASSTGDTPGQETVVFLAGRYARLAETDPVLEDAIRRSGLDISIDEADRRVSAAADSEVGFITITATGPDADEAQALATAESAALVETVARQERAKIEQGAAVLEPQIAEVAAQLAAIDPDDPQRAVLEAQYSALIQKRTELLSQRSEPGGSGGRSQPPRRAVRAYPVPRRRARVRRRPHPERRAVGGARTPQRPVLAGRRERGGPARHRPADPGRDPTRRPPRGDRSVPGAAHEPDVLELARPGAHAGRRRHRARVRQVAHGHRLGPSGVRSRVARRPRGRRPAPAGHPPAPPTRGPSRARRPPVEGRPRPRRPTGAGPSVPRA